MADRAERLRERRERTRERVDRGAAEDLGAGDEPAPSTGEKADKAGEMAMPDKTDKPSKTSVKERPSVLMYLPEDVHTELAARFDELNAEYKREHGEGLEKNRDYYPAVVKAGLEGKDIFDVLDE